MDQVCKHCGVSFSYEKWRRRRVVCDDCLKLPQARASADYNAKIKAVARTRTEMTMESLTHRGELISPLVRVAAALGATSQRLVQEEERALAKLRAHPELLELWRAVMQEGVPAEEDAGAVVLEYQDSLREWWELHDYLSRNNCHSEAVELMGLITAFTDKLNAYLEMSRR